MDEDADDDDSGSLIMWGESEKESRPLTAQEEQEKWSVFECPPCIYLSIHPSIRPSILPISSIRLSVCLSVCLSVDLSLFLSGYPSYLSQSVHLSKFVSLSCGLLCHYAAQTELIDASGIP